MVVIFSAVQCTYSHGAHNYTHTHTLNYLLTNTHTLTQVGLIEGWECIYGWGKQAYIQRNKQRMVLNKAFATQTNVYIQTQMLHACISYFHLFVLFLAT